MKKSITLDAQEINIAHKDKKNQNLSNLPVKWFGDLPRSPILHVTLIDNKVYSSSGRVVEDVLFRRCLITPSYNNSNTNLTFLSETVS